jgi:hypothetical protein
MTLCQRPDSKNQKETAHTQRVSLLTNVGAGRQPQASNQAGTQVAVQVEAGWRQQARGRREHSVAVRSSVPSHGCRRWTGLATHNHNAAHLTMSPYRLGMTSTSNLDGSLTSVMHALSTISSSYRMSGYFSVWC